MSSNIKNKGKEADKSKSKETEKVTLPSVNNTKSNGKGNAATTPKKQTEQLKSSSQVEKLPAIKQVSSPIPDNAAVSVPSDSIPPSTSDATENQPVAVVEGLIPLVDNSQAEVTENGLASSSVAAAEDPVAEKPPTPKPPQNGKVTLVYEQYNEQFDIVNGSTTHENIDEVYCLTFVMPNCLIHLSKHNPQQKRQLEADGNLDLFIEEDPRGIYHGLEVDQTYYVYVEQEAEQLARDQARMKQIANNMEGAKSKNGSAPFSKDDGRVLESCSCIYGNPCVDEYGCKDWNNRFAIATKNGWKGF